MTVKLLVDSTTDLPAEWLAKWDIPVLAAYVNFGDESFPDDGVALPRPEFYRRLEMGKGLPTTSAPAPGMAQKLMRQQLEKAEHVVAFALASQFSSIYNTMRLAAERGAGPEEVIAVAMDTRKRLKLYTAIDTLEYLRRGGRVNTFVASVGTLLQIKPIIDVTNGMVSTVQRVRTMSKAVQSLIDLARAQAPLERLAVLHSNYPAGAADLLARLQDIAPTDVITVDITTAIGTHVGAGCLGITTVTKQVK